jgi:hypothetical protein
MVETLNQAEEQKLVSILKTSHKSFVLKALVFDSLREAGSKGKTSDELEKAYRDYATRKILDREFESFKDEWNSHMEGYGILTNRLPVSAYDQKWVLTHNPSCRSGDGDDVFIFVPLDLVEKALVLGYFP